MILSPSIYSRTVGINSIRCNENDTRLDYCEDFYVQDDDITNNFVGVSCNGSRPSKLQTILEGLHHTVTRDTVFSLL